MNYLLSAVDVGIDELLAISAVDVGIDELFAISSKWCINELLAALINYLLSAVDMGIDELLAISSRRDPYRVYL